VNGTVAYSPGADVPLRIYLGYSLIHSHWSGWPHKPDCEFGGWPISVVLASCYYFIIIIITAQRINWCWLLSTGWEFDDVFRFITIWRHSRTHGDRRTQTQTDTHRQTYRQTGKYQGCREVLAAASRLVSLAARTPLRDVICVNLKFSAFVCHSFVPSGLSLSTRLPPH